MSGFFQAIGEQRKMFADWTDRIAKGEAPKVAPPRPTGVERPFSLLDSKLQPGLEWPKSQIQRAPPHSISHASQCPSHPNSAGISDSVRVSQRVIDGGLDRSSRFATSAFLSIASARNQSS
jgi:hypothetical protein